MGNIQSKVESGIQNIGVMYDLTPDQEVESCHHPENLAATAICDLNPKIHKTKRKDERICWFGLELWNTLFG